MFFVWCVIAIFTSVFVYVFPTMLVYQLTPYRSSLIVCVVFSVFALIYYLKSNEEARSTGYLILLLLGIVALLSGTFTGVAIFSLVGCILLTLNSHGWRKGVALTSVFIVLVLLKQILNDYLLYDAPSITRDFDKLIAFIAFLFVFSLCARYFVDKLILRHVSLLGCVAVILIAIGLFSSRYISRPNDTSLLLLNDYMAAAKVVNTHSTIEQPILMGPLIDMPMLEVTAARGSILQLPKSHVAYLAPRLITKFNPILNDFGIDIRTFEGNWVDLIREAPEIWKNKLTDEHVYYLAKKYESPLLLTYKEHSLDFPALYKGSYFTVYNIEQKQIPSE